MSWTIVGAGSVLLASVALVAGASTRNPAVAEIDRALSETYTPEAPGATAIVVRRGKVLFRKSYGMANLETRTALAPEMALPIGSVTKPFTAAAILAAVQQGKLRLDDPVKRFFQDHPALPPGIAVEHLLTHTSGIKSFTDMQAWFEAIRDPTKAVPEEKVVEMVLREPLVFAPGTQAAYSNSNYLLLGVILQKLSGQGLATVISSSVLRPLGMRRTFCTSTKGIEPVLGYARTEQGYAHRPPLGMGGCEGSGGLASTVDDLGRWNAALSTGAVLSQASRAKMLQPYTLADGRAGSFTHGWEAWDHGGRRYILHGGYTWGFVSSVVHNSSDGITVALVSNNTSPPEQIDVGYLAKRIALIAAGRGAREPRAVAIDPAVLATYMGVYANAVGGQRKVLKDGDQLFTERVGGPRHRLFPESPRRFFYRNSFARLTFTTDAAGKVTGLVQDGEGRPEEWKRVGDLEERKAIRVDPSVLASYEGEYEIRAGQLVAVTREGERLFAQPAGGGRDELFAENETNFFLKTGDTEFTFVKVTDGKAQAVILHTGEWNIEAKRVK